MFSKTKKDILLIYPKEAIQKLTAWVEDDDSSAFNWLLEKGYKELTVLKDAVRRDVKALEFLLVNKHIILAAFVNAVWEDSKAFSVLMKSKNIHWAATANVINGDSKAENWLRKNGLGHYVVLALKIQARIRKEGDQKTSIFRGPINV